jgi:hypothetical protein
LLTGEASSLREIGAHTLWQSDFTISSKTPKLESAARKMSPGKEVRQGDITQQIKAWMTTGEDVTITYGQHHDKC